MVDEATTVSHCKVCVGKQPEVVIPLAASAIVRCTRCGTLHSGKSFPLRLATRKGEDEG